MKSNRFILFLSIAVITMQGMGALRAFHNFTHHDTHPTHEHTADQHTPTKQAPNSPSDQPTDEDCELCLSLNTLTTTLNDPTTRPLHLPSITQLSTQPITVVCSLYAPSDNPARAPPLHMIRS